MKKHYRKENNCLNCGTTLEGEFCHNCGQENLEMKESFGHMMSHAISDYFHFDDQFFHTLKPLLFKPGKLTNEYMAGHRVKYLHPVKMYIFISVVYFLLLFQSGFTPVNVNETPNKPETKEALIKENKALNSSVNDPDIPQFAKEQMLAQEQRNNMALKKLEKGSSATIDSTANAGEDNNLYSVDVNKYKNYQQYLDAQKKLPADNQDGLLTRMFTKNMIYYHQKYGAQAKEMLMEGFRHSIPKMMFLMLPLFALILKVTFFKDKKLYVEHMIYSFHLHCFLFLFLAMIILLEMILPNNKSLTDCMGLAAGVYIFWYIYKSLRVVYHRSRFRTFTKLIGISFSYLLVFLVCITIAVFITALFRPMASE